MRGRMRKGRGVLDLRLASFADKSERQSFVRCTECRDQSKVASFERFKPVNHDGPNQPWNLIISHPRANMADQDLGLPI
ncbi:hypothetical protein EVAR_3518_1 [Eumeta japonica]|uniref:Uncharacterized protein n=1 Tax=Eumeta variegata TaxID=151549 RepID=A0A4C1SVD9_EUMVA|nr:hypothetical protein EVAR_3518_1 [Eumeta japonica]